MLVKIRYITSNNTDALTRIFYENGEKFSEPQYSSVSLIYSQHILNLIVRGNPWWTWNCLGKSNFSYFWLVWIILRHFQPGAKNFTWWLFFFGRFSRILRPDPKNA